MPFGAFALISLIYAVIGIRVIRDLIVHRREAFDRTFTPPDRYLVDQSAFFVLVPFAVALHELGHAVAIWSFGGAVTDFGYYVFAGFVSYQEPFSDVQRTIVAAAGTIVNIILIALAIGFVFLRRRPMRAAWNELLIQFAIISGINALVVYPLLDVATGLNGDWTQMYDSGVPALSALIGAIHLGLLAAAFLIWRDPRFQRRLAELTDLPPGVERRVLGSLRSAGQSPGQAGELNSAERTLREVAERVAAGWPAPVRRALARGANGSQISLAWSGNGAQRAVAVQVADDGTTMIIGAAGSASTADQPRLVRQLRRWVSLPDVDRLTLDLRVAMEEVDRWYVGGATYEGASSSDEPVPGKSAGSETAD